MLGTGSNTHRNHFLVKEFEIYMRRQDKYTLTINLSIKHRITEDQREASEKRWKPQPGLKGDPVIDR